MSADTIARLKITLDDVEPTVLRRVDVPFDIRLDRLHLTIQAAMGWTNSHLYELCAGDVGWSTPYPDADWSGDFLDARKARLNDILEDIGTKKLTYIYDFGDGWEHTVTLEAIGPAAAETTYPRLVAAEGRCPPEDVGGPWGYDEYLKAIRNPRHKRHVEMVQWRGPGFDPAVVDTHAIGRELAAFAKRLSRRKTKPRAKSGSRARRES